MVFSKTSFRGVGLPSRHIRFLFTGHDSSPPPVSYESVQQVLHLDCSYLCFFTFVFKFRLSFFTFAFNFYFIYIYVVIFALVQPKFVFAILINYGTVQQVLHLDCFLRCTFSFKLYFFFFIPFTNTL